MLPLAQRVLLKPCTRRARGRSPRRCRRRRRRRTSSAISITTGNTTAIPASASVPRWDSHQVSTRLVLACASITKMFGQESRKRVEAMGPRRKSSRREPPTAPALCNWSAVPAATPLVRSDSPTLFEDHQRPGKGRTFKCYPSTTGSLQGGCRVRSYNIAARKKKKQCTNTKSRW